MELKREEIMTNTVEENKDVNSECVEVENSEVEEVNAENVSKEEVADAFIAKAAKETKSVVVSEAKSKSTEVILGLCSFVVSFVFMCLGFYKMFAYENGEYYPYDSVNAYVGGDAYNYIINGTYATAYFVLATACVITGMGFFIIDAIKKSNK